MKKRGGDGQIDNEEKMMGDVLRNSHTDNGETLMREAEMKTENSGC